MKKIFFIAIALITLTFSYAQQKSYVTFQADIANRNSDTLYIRTNQSVTKLLTVNKKGVFKDTLSVKEGIYLLFDGKEYTQMYLKNGYDLKVNLDAKKFDESIVYKGIGEKENNYLAQYTLTDAKLDYDALLNSDEAVFNKTVSEKKTTDIAALEKDKLDPNFTALQKKNIESSLEGLTQYYKKALETKKLNNTPAPSFDYINYAGGKSTLADFKGKYVYIDAWATWCGPCRAEIPFLKAKEEMYHDKNIVFLSISIDTQKDFEKWKKFVGEKELKGVQLFADNDWKSEFVKAYNIDGIPRFILVDPKGMTVNANAPRPSAPEFDQEVGGLLN